MHPAVASILHYAREYPQLFAPLAFSISTTVANIYEPVNYSLFITSVSWVVVWASLVFKVGLWSGASKKRRCTSWLAGAFLALAQICERAACDKQGIWATKGLLPVLTVLLSGNELLPKLLTLPTHAPHHDEMKDANNSNEQASHAPPYRLLTVLTISASVVLACYTVSTTTALGISNVIFAATGLVLFEIVTTSVDQLDSDATRGLALTNGTPSSQQQLVAVRDVAVVLVVICGIASSLMEAPLKDAISWEPAYSAYNRDWKTLHDYRILQSIIWTIPVKVSVNVLMFIIISGHGAVTTSLLMVTAYIIAKIHFTSSFMGAWFAIIYGSSATLYMLSTPPMSFTDKRGFLRMIRRITFSITALSIGLLLFSYVSELKQQGLSSTPVSFAAQPPSPFEPLPIALGNGHPAAQLISVAETEFQATLYHQSKSLTDAVREYRRRYGIAPPPHFDKWYEFAVRNNVLMIDEYDTINEMLLPFWALKPATIRSRITRELGGEDSALIGVSIRNGAVTNTEKGEEWQQQATTGMMEKFIQYLPDMDLGFNTHDEPRVVVPTNLLSQMVSKARDEVLPRVAKHSSPSNAFSSRPKDLADGKRFTETYVSNFNRFSHQQTWTQARLSCPIDSQSQNYEDYAPDNTTAYAAGPLGYVYNITAFSDICFSPSLSSTFGFFERPNAFSIIHELTPIFSQSKISSFQDILYPSPWYWKGKVSYDASTDTTWENKTNALYWRGSTTGGFSRNNGWRRQHRQHIVQRLNAPEKAQIIVSNAQSRDSTNSLSVAEVNRRDYKSVIDVHFSHVGQCDPGDCAAQKEFFHVKDHAEPENAWYFKHLLDMDGNAFSGRFYSFLKSNSLTYKMALFREWHAEWLKPWVHYIPLSLKGDEHLDLVQWFSGAVAGASSTPDKSGNGESEGEKKARQIAKASTMWHDQALRNVDMEVWFFRLLLEYARVIDDNREEIGFPGP